MQANSPATDATMDGNNGETALLESLSCSFDESESFFRRMTDALPTAIYTTDAKGRITYFNPACVEFSGRTPELGSAHWCVTWKLFYPDGRPMPHDECPMAIALKEGRVVRGAEAIAERPDGTRVWFQPYPTPFLDDEGNIVGGVNMLVDITERKAAEEARRAGEDRYRQTLSLMPAAVYSCDASGLITYYNQQAARLWGREPQAGDTDERFCGSEQMILPDGTPLPHDKCPMAVALREGRAFRDQEVNIRRPDGSLVQVMVSIDPIRNDQGEVIGAINAFLDMSAVKQAERALRDRQICLDGQREALESAVNGAPLQASLGVLVRTAIEAVGNDARAGFYLANDEGTAIYHVVGMPQEYAEAVDGFKVGPDALACGLATATGKPVLTADVRNDPLWQPWLWMAEKFEYRACWSFPIYAAGGKFAGTLAIYSRQPREATQRDQEIGLLLTHTASIIISRHKHAEVRRQAEQALRESEERFRMLADNMAQLAWTCDILGNVTWYNKRWLDYTGLSFEEMRDWGWMQCHHPDHVDRVVASVTRSRQSGEIWEDTFPLRGADGQYRWFLSRAIPIRDAEGNILRWFGTNTDVTEQLAAEESLREADRRKNEFLAMLAHELRNPLAPIRNAVQILRLAGADETIQSVSDTLERQVNQLVRMVDDLLDLNRISKGKTELRTRRVELASIVNDAIESVSPICENRGHDLSVALPDHPIYLDADAARMAQVLGNLLSNACKFTNSGGRITLTAEQQGEHVVIRVRDNGIGLAADQLSRIFDMFAQVDTSLERSASGLGIGLTLVKNLVEMHGGTVEARSQGIGQGSEFVICLPTSVVTPESQAPVRPLSKPTTTSPRRILVVDDNRDSAKTMAMLLKVTGHQTQIAFDGLEAVAAAESFRPDIVLLDIGLPKLNGYETAVAIRQQPWGQDVLLIALTGWGQDDDRQKSKDAGFDAHLVKPVDHSVLTKLLADSPRQA